MSQRRATVPYLCTLLAIASAAAQAPVPTAAWRGDAQAIEAVAARAPAPAAAVLKQWAPFTEAAHYRLVLSDDARVLLVLSLAEHARKQPKKENKEVEALLALVRDTVAVTERCTGPMPAEAAPVVVVAARTADYGALLDHVGHLDPRLQEWARGGARTTAGFVLSEPLVAAWITDPHDAQEWQPQNELVHRTAQLLLRRTAHQLPSWLLLGLAWHVEDTVRAGIWCFPYRSGFVSCLDHGDWGTAVARECQKPRRKENKLPPAIGIDEFAAWRPQAATAAAAGDKPVDRMAQLAFGLARFLAYEHAPQLPKLLAELGEAQARGSKVMVTDTDWRTDPDYVVPPAEQLALLQRLDGDLLGKATDWLARRKAAERRPVART